MDSVEEINGGNDLRDSKSGNGKNYGEVFSYWDRSFAGMWRQMIRRRKETKSK
jgi:sterol desaturase/sphingolipid hydroxylase (fatty acid hydroxylase superfamily)